MLTDSILKMSLEMETVYFGNFFAFASNINRAVSDQLVGGPEEHFDIRQNAVDYMEKNRLIQLFLHIERVQRGFRAFCRR